MWTLFCWFVGAGWCWLVVGRWRRIWQSESIKHWPIHWLWRSRVLVWRWRDSWILLVGLRWITGVRIPWGWLLLVVNWIRAGGFCVGRVGGVGGVLVHLAWVLVHGVGGARRRTSVDWLLVGGEVVSGVGVGVCWQNVAVAIIWKKNPVIFNNILILHLGQLQDLNVLGRKNSKLKLFSTSCICYFLFFGSWNKTKS